MSGNNPLSFFSFPLTSRVGSLGVLLFFTILVVQALLIGLRARDDFGRYLAIGVAAMLFFQAFVNIGMNIGVMPVTGLTLPLISFGRNSLIITLGALGVLLSVSAHRSAAPYRQQGLRWVAASRPGASRPRGVTIR